ncbi:hypothetical protein APHAL10511_002387 [Amanita phalloides]|nr:hypothetical protein APHAL10511_002387 [Amanita phalloides]
MKRHAFRLDARPWCDERVFCHSRSTHSSDRCACEFTRFQGLLQISFREFSIITDQLALRELKRFRNEIVHDIEMFLKRAAVRNLRTPGLFGKEQAGLGCTWRCVVPPSVPAAGLAPRLQQQLTTRGGHIQQLYRQLTRTFGGLYESESKDGVVSPCSGKFGIDDGTEEDGIGRRAGEDRWLVTGRG